MTEQAIPGNLIESGLTHPLNRLAVWVSAGVFLALCWLFFGFTADDSYIVARYGRNLVEYGLLEFNPGEPISALTSPLHGLIMAGLYALTSEPVTLYKILASIFCGLSMLSLIRVLPVDSRGLGAIVMLTSPFAALWSVGGLETPVLMALVALFCAAILRTDGRAGPWLVILAALMFLTRYDSALFAAPATLVVMWTNRSSGRYWVAFAGAVGLAGGWLIFAQLTYGSVFPTSYFLKVGSFFHPENFLHILYVASFLILTTGPWIVARVFFGKKHEFHTHLIRYGIYLLIPYFFTMASTHMMFSYRALIPYLPALVCLLIGAGKARRGLNLGMAGGVMVINVVLSWVLLNVTINPSIGHLSAGGESRWRPGEPALSYEYASVNVYEYQTFTDTLKLQADALAVHWDSDETPSLLTMAGGVAPWYLPDTHVMEILVSARAHCPYNRRNVSDLWRYADYIQLFQDGDGRIYPGPNTEDWAIIRGLPIVHDVKIEFTMRPSLTRPNSLARVMLFYNPTPEPRPTSLSKRYFEACRLD